MIGVGNENWDQQYIDRYTKFEEALRAKHPEIKLVSSAGPSPDDAHFKFAWPKLRELHADIVDEHCYDKPQWFLDNTHRYDKYDRNGPKVFMGEYAAQSDKVVSVKNRNTLECALAEAAYMTGLERNGDVVQMASYAPLFANTEAWQWTPNLIWVDSLHVLPTANYFVQQLFAKNHGDATVPLEVTGLADEKSLFTSATKDDATGEIILKVVNPTTEARTTQIHLAGLSGKVQAKQTVLSGSQRMDMNAMAKPPKVAPVESELSLNASTFDQTFPPLSLTVLRCKAK
jgi:alpha-L-arabinofuranosidase